MINKINTIRTVADKLTSHLFMEGKTKITKPGAIIPGAVAVSGVAITLETKDNSAKLTVQKGNTEIQTANFNYKETENGYELVSAKSSYFYDDKDNKEFRRNDFIIRPEREENNEYSINYANAPMRKTTRKYIDKINSSMAQVAGYQSDKKDYDPQESHTYGKKSLQRDIPALLKFLDIVAPNSEFTLKMKDKLKKDNKTSLIAFEVNGTENGNEIVRGFMSASGDSISYHIDTKDMTLVGEQSPNRNMSRAYLKPEKIETVNEEVKEETSNNETTDDISENESTTQTDTTQNPQVKEEEKAGTPNIEVEQTTNDKPSSQTATNEKKKNEIDEDGKAEATIEVSEGEQKKQVSSNGKNKVYPIEYYINLVFETAVNQDIPTRKKAELYKQVLAQAFVDGYDKSDLENILSGNGLNPVSKYCKKQYVEAGIALAEKGGIQIPAKTLDIKLKELQRIKTKIEDEDLSRCVQNMIHDCVNIQDTTIKEDFVDKALNILNDNSSETFIPDLLLFIKEFSQINDDMKLHYEIYEEIVSDKKVQTLKSLIEQMINNVSDSHHHEKRGEFLTQLYTANDLKALEQLKNQVQTLLSEKPSKSKKEESPQKEPKIQLSKKSLTNTNRKLVNKLLECKSPSDISLTYNEMRNLVLDIGFEESTVKGSHHKFIPPIDIFFNGEKQSYITISSNGKKIQNPAQIDDLINICRQYYGDEK